jgi:propanediol utilization protein
MSAVRKILVPIKELSSRPIPAVLKAAQLARAHGAGLELFHSLRQPIVDLERGNPRRALPIAVPVRVESHHAHLTAVVIEQLFCDLYRLHPSGSVVQGGQYKTMEKVTLIGPEGRSREIPIVGPPSAANEIEISYTDALILGIRAPVRESGDLTGTPGVTLKGPRAQVALGTGVICAMRHVRMSPGEAESLELKDRDRVNVSVRSANRSPCFQDVLVRVAPGYSLELLLDTDEANAAVLGPGDYAVLTCRHRRMAND